MRTDNTNAELKPSRMGSLGITIEVLEWNPKTRTIRSVRPARHFAADRAALLTKTRGFIRGSGR